MADHPDGKNAYFWAGIFFLILFWVTTLGRIYIRIFLVKKFGADDWALIGTVIITSAFAGQLIAVCLLSWQAPVGVFPIDNLKPAIELILGCEASYIAGATLLKITLGLLLLRVLTARWMRLTIYTVLCFTTIYGTFYFFLILFQCGSPKYFFERILSSGQCLSRQTILGTSYVHAIITALADIIFAILPGIFVWKSNLVLRAKLSVGFILILGSVGCVCTLIRIGWIHYLVKANTQYFVTAQGISIMSCAELSIGITCISLATYKPLIQLIWPSSRSQYYYTNHNGTEHSRAEEVTSPQHSYTDGRYGHRRIESGSETNLHNLKPQDPNVTVYSDNYAPPNESSRASFTEEKGR